MSNIKYGSIEYFSLLEFQDKIRSDRYDKFDLPSLNKLRLEVEIKIKQLQQLK